MRVIKIRVFPSRPLTKAEQLGIHLMVGAYPTGVDVDGY